MINEFSRETDMDDAVVLLLAMVEYAERYESIVDESVVCKGHANLLKTAKKAAKAIARNHATHEADWDGCVWLERLEYAGCDSLAGYLYALDNTSATHSKGVEGVVIDWLQRKGL